VKLACKKKNTLLHNNFYEAEEDADSCASEQILLQNMLHLCNFFTSFGMKPVRGDIHVLTSILVTNTSKPFFAEFT
jgi:hypothetical protein